METHTAIERETEFRRETQTREGRKHTARESDCCCMQEAVSAQASTPSKLSAPAQRSRGIGGARAELPTTTPKKALKGAYTVGALCGDRLLSLLAQEDGDQTRFAEGWSASRGAGVTISADVRLFRMLATAFLTELRLWPLALLSAARRWQVGWLPAISMLLVLGLPITEADTASPSFRTSASAPTDARYKSPANNGVSYAEYSASTAPTAAPTPLRCASDRVAVTVSARCASDRVAVTVPVKVTVTVTVTVSARCVPVTVTVTVTVTATETRRVALC